MADEQRMVFHIPVNFAEEGTVFGGRLKSRNAMETILFLILFLQPIFALRVGTKAKIYLAVLIVLPVCIFSIIGIQGESLSSFLMGVIYFMKTRRVWGKPDEGYRMELGWKERRRRSEEKRPFKKAGKGRKREKRAKKAGKTAFAGKQKPAEKDGGQAAEKDC